MNYKIIITGATGMVGEGVLIECLAHPQVSAVLSISRRPTGMLHPKLITLRFISSLTYTSKYVAFLILNCGFN